MSAPYERTHSSPEDRMDESAGREGEGVALFCSESVVIDRERCYCQRPAGHRGSHLTSPDTPHGPNVSWAAPVNQRGRALTPPSEPNPGSPEGQPGSLAELLDGLQEDAEEPGDCPDGWRDGMETAIRRVREWSEGRYPRSEGRDPV